MLSGNDISNLCLAIVKHADGLEAAVHVTSVDGLIKLSQPTYLRVGRPLDRIHQGNQGVWFVTTNGPLYRADMSTLTSLPTVEIDLCDMDITDPRLIACLYRISELLDVIDNKKQLIATHFSVTGQLVADNLKRLFRSENGFD